VFDIKKITQVQSKHQGKTIMVYQEEIGK